MTCVERRLSLAPNSFKGTTGNFDVNLSHSNLICERKKPFWKTKYFLIPMVIISCTVIGVLTFFTVNEIYNKGPRSNAAYNLDNASRYKLKNSAISSKNQIKSASSSPVIQQQIRSYRVDRDEVHEQEISVTCELKNGIKELNNEIKRLYDSLTRLDERMNREKRGLNERTTAIADCVQMKGKFKKIYEDLNRISETLSLIDENGICRCKCPLDKIPGIPGIPDTGTTTQATRTTTGDPPPLELTTFASDGADEQQQQQQPRGTGKTKQLKKIIVTDYDPQTAANCLNSNDDKLRCDTDRETTAAETTTKDDDRTTETEDTATPAVVPAILHANNRSQTYEPHTVYSEIVTKIYKDERFVTSEKPKGSAGPIENVKTTMEFEYDETSAAQEDPNSEDEVSSRSTATDENVSGSTTESATVQKETDGRFTTNVFESTTKSSDSGKKFGSTRKNSESTTPDENDIDSTTRISDSEENFTDDRYYVTEKSFVPTTTTDENIFQPTTQKMDDRTYGSEAKVTDNVSSSTPSKIKTITESATKTSVPEKTEKIVDVTGRNSAEDRDKNYHRNGTENVTSYGPVTETIGPANENRNPDKTGNQQQPVQSKWYPVCFYPVPCSPDAADYLPDAQHVGAKNTIQYSSQSLNAYKKKASFADPTVIQNNYPIISYCPKGMVCATTDFAGQPNVLHCMMKSSTAHGDGAMPLNSNRTDENVPKQPIQTVYNEMKSPAMTTVKSARDSDEIITGNLDCPLNTFPCVDNSRCVDTENWCDGRIHCDDASDESQCNCKERIDKDKLCDGYYDCPNGEDELGCFGCNNETFSCGDWNIISQRSSCFQRKSRCDFTKHCPNGRDEEECTLLSRLIENPNQIFFVSYSTGYLHQNWRGNWYPMCGGDKIETWAEKACAIESGEKSKPSKVQYVNGPTGYDGPYVGIDKENKITLLDSCTHQGILVECETETCGVRSELKFIKNVDPDRMRRSSYFDFSNNNTSRISRSKDPRVVGGVASNPGAWPWLIALYQDGIFHCGGVILSDEWVLTAAHCVNNYQKHFYEVQAGILRRFSFSPMEQVRMVTHVIVHTQYSRSTMINDLAVLKLERSLEFNRWIRPVCLPDHKLDWIPFPGTICTAVGWGATVEHGPDPDNMREVEVPILPECTHKTDIDGREICAGYLSGGHDTCQGDSGGPLLCRDPNNLDKWYVAGIVSHGEGCARPMEPGVYTRVALFMGWIIQVTGEQQLPQERPQQYCPGIRCETGNHCIPTKRQCDKYVDCMNAEDERDCDYTGSQYRVDFYRSKNTDHSNLKYSKLKSSKENENSTALESQPVTFQDTNSTIPKSNTTARSQDVNVETSTVGIKLNNNNTTGLKDAVLDAIRQLFDNQFTEKTFSCTRITQVVLANHRCDGSVDCEDGTDEESCDCKSRLASMYNSSAVCDGVVDCYDGTDEMGCGEPRCKSGEIVCGLPKKCVKISAWCDGVVDCSGDGIDEKYCVALANTNAGFTTVVMDTTGRPTLRQSGMVAVNNKGVWRMRCVDDRIATKIAHETCSDLQFSNSNFFEKRISSSNPLPLNLKNLKFTDMCQGLYVECSARKTMDVKLQHWHADIMVDGKLAQSGVLMDNSWVLVKRTGLNFKKSYVTTVLGSGVHPSSRIKSPYEQIVRVDGLSKIPDTNLDLLHLSTKANVSRGVTPLKLPLFQPSPGENDTCYAIGYLNDHNAVRVDTVLLRPDTKRPCPIGHICFTVLQKPRSCMVGKNISHVTAVVCESNFGLFLAAYTVQRDVDFCGRNARVQLPETEELMNKIAKIIDENVNPTPPPLCSGKRCQLGECVPWDKVCDGIPHCRDEQDETIKMCRARTEKCRTNNTLCICGVGNFRCANGKCVKKSAFCNGIDNCGDGTDEPKSCRTNACAEYLRLTAPERLCDGRWDCLDKTDEDFTNCPASYCNRTNVYQCRSSNKCISLELVCDGEMDCPESDDEEKCIGLITSVGKKHEGVLATRSYGNWHAQCVTDDYTDVDYHSLCRGLGFSRALGIRKTTGAEIVFENFAMVQLNVGTDVTIRSPTKNILQYTGRPCTTVYVACSSP